MAGRFGTFVIGGLVGTIVGLLVAPRPGRETRAIIADRANSFIGDAQGWGEQAVSRGTSVVGGIASDVVARGQNVVENVQEATGNVDPIFRENNDELRDKIDAARQRIAEQVAKNAEESAGKADDVISADPIDTDE